MIKMKKSVYSCSLGFTILVNIFQHSDCKSERAENILQHSDCKSERAESAIMENKKDNVSNRKRCSELVELYSRHFRHGSAKRSPHRFRHSKYFHLCS
jgi:hypothetical protein